MSMPKFYEIMLPLLKLYEDGKIHHRNNFTESIIEYFQLSDEEISETVSAGWSRIKDRLNWATTFLKQAELLSSPKRGYYKITERGKEVLAKNLDKLYPEDIKKMYPDVMQNSFYNPELRNKKDSKNNVSTEQEESFDLDTDPIQMIENGYTQYREALSSDLLDEIKNKSPEFFEKLVVDLLLAMGYGGAYGDGRPTQISRDGGIDGVIKEDKLGLDMIYIQAKKWENTVSRPEIDKFIGVLSRKRAKKGVFITTSNFSSDALKSVDSLDSKIVLVDGEKLVNLMIDFGVGVSVKTSYEIKDIDSDYFEG
jgi:restriction system protein